MSLCNGNGINAILVPKNKGKKLKTQGKQEIYPVATLYVLGVKYFALTLKRLPNDYSFFFGFLRENV